MKNSELTTPDIGRCQAEIPNGEGPFTLGGGHKMIRCTAKPKVVLTEKEPGPDGKRGSMALCRKCLHQFNIQEGTPDVEVEVI